MIAIGSGSVGTARAWPVVPPPRADESLSSWLERIGGAYGLTGLDLLAPDWKDAWVAGTGIDGDPPEPLIRWLARKTGLGPRRIRAMTLSGYVPFLLDGLTPPAASLTSYVARFRLVSRQDEPIVGVETVPWLDARWGMMWGCSACLAADAVPYRRRHWRVPWMLTCPLHGGFLEEVLVTPGRSWTAFAAPFGRASPERELVRLDRATHQAVTRGVVDGPQGHIRGGAWVRLLRTVLEELVRLAPEDSPRGRGLAELWDDLGVAPPPALRPSPYEALPPQQKLKRMRAAALALERARSLLTDWMEGNGLALLDPEGSALRRWGRPCGGRAERPAAGDHPPAAR